MTTQALNIACLLKKANPTPQERALIEIGSLDYNPKDISVDDFNVARADGVFTKWSIPTTVTTNFVKFSTFATRALNDFCDVPKNVWVTQVEGKKKARFIPQVHGVSPQNSNPVQLRTAATSQLKILQVLKKNGAKVIVDEGQDKPLTSQQAQAASYSFQANGWRNATGSISAAEIRRLLQDYTMLESADLNEQQIAFLNTYGASEAYVALERDVTLLPDITPQEDVELERKLKQLVAPVLAKAKQQGVPFPEESYNSAINYLMEYAPQQVADFQNNLDAILMGFREKTTTAAVNRAAQAHPNTTVYLVYGAAHVFCDNFKHETKLGLEAIRLLDEKDVNAFFRECDQ